MLQCCIYSLISYSRTQFECKGCRAFGKGTYCSAIRTYDPEDEYYDQYELLINTYPEDDVHICVTSGVEEECARFLQVLRESVAENPTQVYLDSLSLSLWYYNIP